MKPTKFAGKTTYRSGSKNKVFTNEIIYANPAKPLDFSFKNIKTFDELRKIEPRSGTRRNIEDLIKDDKFKSENSFNKNEKNNDYYDEDSNDKLEKKPKNEISKLNLNMRESETKLNNSKAIEKLNIKKEENNQNINKLDSQKKKVKYVTYNNALIVHSNQIKTFENIHNVLYDILPDISYLQNKNKVELIQWVDISHNRLEDIHIDILSLPYLKILYCHANYIKDLESIRVLSQAKRLINLTLHGNPIEQIKGYRQFVIEMVPSLERLDFTLVSEKELDIIHFRGSRFGEKRDKTGKVLTFPKLDDEILKRMKMPKDEIDENQGEY